MSTVEHVLPVEAHHAFPWPRYLLDSVLACAGALLVTGIIYALRLYPHIPIIVLSVKGADDYVAKPFGIDEVLARVRVALRHAVQPPSGAGPRFQAGPLSIDFAQRHVELNGQEISLTPTEFDLLKVLIIHRGKILTRQMLLKEVWGAAAHDRTHSLHVYVALLRQKIEPIPERPRFILNIPGVGYRFNDSAEP